mmetsp:Transcript_105354/g.186587  ORF Transcript_105354/g.186587 Transcript_105354/m.186587 type:complete len:216 (-) Transcript_105354:134-781(-)
MPERSKVKKQSLKPNKASKEESHQQQQRELASADFADLPDSAEALDLGYLRRAQLRSVQEMAYSLLRRVEKESAHWLASHGVGSALKQPLWRKWMGSWLPLLEIAVPKTLKLLQMRPGPCWSVVLMAVVVVWSVLMAARWAWLLQMCESATWMRASASSAQRSRELPVIWSILAGIRCHSWQSMRGSAINSACSLTLPSMWAPAAISLCCCSPRA